MNHFESYLELLIKLHKDSEDTDDIIVQCDHYWHKLTESEMKLIELVSAALDGNQEFLNKHLSMVDV